MIEKVLTGSDVEIVNLYKTGSHAPYTPLEKGNFGYLGVLLARKTDGKVQCHVCGKWRESLGSHVIGGHKEFKSLAMYKRRFGFPILFPLCSSKLSNALRIEILNKAKRHGGIKVYAKKLSKLAQSPKTIKKRIKANLISRKTPSYLNSLDICRDQIRRRVMAVAQHIGHFPSSHDLRKYDHSALKITISRYGSWNKFKQAEFSTESRRDQRQGVPRKFTSDYLLFVLREFKRKNKVNPVQQDFNPIKIEGTPSLGAYVQRFGSWSRALSMAGLQVNPKETKTYRKAG